MEAFEHFDPAPFTDLSPGGLAAVGAVLDEIGNAQTSTSTKARTGYWRDIVVRKPKTEIDYIKGEIVRLGEKPAYRHRLIGSNSGCSMRLNGCRRMHWKNIEELTAAVP